MKYSRKIIILQTISFLFKIILMVNLIFILMKIFSKAIPKNNYENLNLQYAQELNVIYDGELQINNKNFLFFLKSDKINILENSILLHNNTFYSNNIEGNSKKIIYDKIKKEIILEEKPNIIFLNK